MLTRVLRNENYTPQNARAEAWKLKYVSESTSSHPAPGRKHISPKHCRQKHQYPHALLGTAHFSSALGQDAHLGQRFPECAGGRALWGKDSKQPRDLRKATATPVSFELPGSLTCRQGDVAIKTSLVDAVAGVVAAHDRRRRTLARLVAQPHAAVALDTVGLGCTLIA